MFRGVVLALGLICTPVLAAETDYRLEIFELLHRSAEDLLPLIRPLLAEGAIVEAEGSWLLVKTLPENLREVERVLEKVDRPARLLRVTVTWRDGRPGGDNRRVYGTHRKGSAQRLQLLEGEWARIELGEAIPVGRRDSVAGPDGAAVSEGVDYLPLMQTVEVRVRGIGERIRLDIRPSRRRESPQDGGRIEVESLVTTVAGRLGEWLELGGQQPALPEEGIKRHSTAPESRQVGIFVRVEEVEP